MIRGLKSFLWNNTVTPMKKNRISIFSLCSCVLLWALALSVPVLAQEKVRTIWIVVPFAAGAAQDLVARLISEELGKQLGANVLVKNIPGAGGTIGALAVAKAAPDGNTLLLAGSGHYFSAHIYPKLAYDAAQDFSGAALIGLSGFVLVVPVGSKANNLTEFIGKVRDRPMRYNYASAGVGSASHLAMASFLTKAGLQMQHIPLHSNSDALIEVMTERAEGAATVAINISALKSNPRIKLLAYSGGARAKSLPELPTVAEAGLPGYAFETWVGLLGPAGTPEKELERINRAMAEVNANPRIRESLGKLGAEFTPASVEAFQSLLRVEWERSSQTVKGAGATLD